MACPLFSPSSPLQGFQAEAMPLGDLFGGECAAASGALIPVDTLRSCCNPGYARANCECAAAHAEADAVRFLVKAHREGAVEVAWAIERNHYPVAVGSMTVDEKAEPATTLERQAKAYAGAYLRSRPNLRVGA